MDDLIVKLRAAIDRMEADLRRAEEHPDDPVRRSEADSARGALHLMAEVCGIDF